VALIMPLQGELGFTEDGPQDGYAKWIALRQMTVEAAAQKLNLPIGHEAEVWLQGGIRLRGKLRLTKDLLFIEEKRIADLALTLDGVQFTYAEIESCVRLDDSVKD
jgi:hypothetical protein